MPIAGSWQGLAQILAERMLNDMAEGFVIALFGWLLLRTMRRRNASTRFAMLFVALAAIAALPIVETIRSNAGSGASVAHSAFRLPAFWAVDAFLIWAVIAVAGLAKIAFGFWQLRRLRQSCTALDPASLHPMVRETLNQFGSERRVILCTSERMRVPTAVGFLKPAIVIPAWAMQELRPAELNAVLLHELAHLRRWDDWTNLAQRIIRAVLFFHPAVWWIGHGLAREREMACDDFVLAATSDRRTYAQCLVSVAEKSFLRRGLALAQAMVGRMQLTAQRVARILDCGCPDLGRSAATKVWKPALGLITAFSAVCLISVPHAPKLVAFDGASGGPLASRLTPPLAVPSSMGARMIPAAFTSPVPRTGVHRKDAVARSVIGHRQEKDGNPLSASAVSARLPQPQPESPRQINASAENDSGNVGQPSAVLLVMQTEQVDQYGHVWSVCMWRLTVFHPADRTPDPGLRKGITAKST